MLHLELHLISATIVDRAAVILDALCHIPDNMKGVAVTASSLGHCSWIGWFDEVNDNGQNDQDKHGSYNDLGAVCVHNAFSACRLATTIDRPHYTGGSSKHGGTKGNLNQNPDVAEFTEMKWVTHDVVPGTFHVVSGSGMTYSMSRICSRCTRSLNSAIVKILYVPSI